MRLSSARTAVIGLVLLLPLAACGSDGGSTAPATTTNPTVIDPLMGSPGATTDATPPSAGVEVSARTITIEDPALGTLVFDALAAGDPAAAADGRLVLLLHGFPESGDGYEAMLTPLAEAGYYAVAPNQRGYSPGARPTAVEDYAVAALAEDVVGMADALGVTGTFHVVGHDWGGAVAWVLAARHPERLASLAALSTPHLDAITDAWNDPSGEQRQEFAYQEAFKQPGYEDALLADGPATFEAVFGRAGIPDEDLARYAEVLGTSDALRAALDWYRANPLPAPTALGPVTVPTLFVFGTDDLAFTQLAADGTARYVDAPYTYEQIEGGSHWLPETQAAAVTPMLLTHLAAHP